MGICTKLMLKNLLILQFWTECISVAEMGKTHMKQGAGGQHRPATQASRHSSAVKRAVRTQRSDPHRKGQ